jgi:hypothetical protein
MPEFTHVHIAAVKPLAPDMLEDLLATTARRVPDRK